VEQGAGEPFDAAALAAARQFEFQPGRLAGGEAVPVTVTFRLRIEPPPAPSQALPPPVKLTGRLLERGTRKPIPDVPVAARRGEETLATATSGSDGRFRLEVPAATFELVAAPVEHERLALQVEARPGEEREETYYLATTLGEFASVVRGERVRREITKQVVPADEVAKLPGSQGDTLKAVLNFPGAARPSFGRGQLILRGSSPADSAAFVDGLEVPQLYHFGGLRSTFAPRFLESLEFVPGNFSADYGRLTGGIVNARVRDPATDMLRGEADFNLYDAGVALEGPLGKDWSFGAAFRRSWIDTLLPLFIPRDSNVSFSSAPRFYDYQILATYQPSERDKVRFLFFGSQDKLVLLFKHPASDPLVSGDLSARIAYHELQALWSRRLGPELKQESWLAVGLQTFDTQLGPQLFFKLDTRRIDARSTWSWQASRAVEVRAGLDLQLDAFDIRLDLPQAPKEGQPPTPVSTRPRIATAQTGTFFDPAAFLELRLQPGDDLQLVPSLRLDYTREIGSASLDPRLAARWRVASATVIKAAVGVYQQEPQPDELARDIGNPDLVHERSVSTSVGFEHALAPGVDLDVTGFYKRLDRLVVRNAAATVDPSQPPYLNTGVGRVYGIEALLRARVGERFFGWVAYTFQRALRTDRPGAAERRFDFDQPHNLTALGTYQLNPRWSLGARFRLVSGNPTTPVTGSVYDAVSDVFVPLYGPVNSTRLGTFHALDVRVDRTWTYERWKLSLYLDVQNVYNRQNPEGVSYSYDFRQSEPATGLPILPILGLKGEW